jgi:glycosyl hydrolase family 20
MNVSYKFREKMRAVHRPCRINTELGASANECVIDDSWVIVLPNEHGIDKVLKTAAYDLQDYLQTSMDVGIPVRNYQSGKRKIRFEISPEISSQKDAFQINIEKKQITIKGQSGRGVFGGSIYLEDLMNLREAPFLTCTEIFCEPAIKSRGVHSGYALDCFADHHLNSIAHAGFTEIYLFVRGIDKCANSNCDIQDVIDRAEDYGLDVMFYSYISGFKHPEDKDAEEYFDNAFGSLFKRYPKAKGILIVGESAEFPSKDPATTGKLWKESSSYGIPDSRPSPGWWPCEDYPDWIKAVAKAIRKYKVDALISFSTYNWLWAPHDVRSKFLAALPKDIQVMVPFEMFKSKHLENGACQQVMDYTISETDFSECCLDEVATARDCGLNIGVTAMTGGTPWNFGTAPYVPVPFQWMEKFSTLKKVNLKYGIDGFYDSHHMGWWPSIVTDLARAVFRQPETDINSLLKKLTVRDFGAAAAEKVMEVWRLWSEAVKFYVATNENQYGPFRIGPSYPFVFHPNVTRTMGSKEIEFPVMEKAYAGKSWLNTFFQPFENAQQSPYSLRLKPELAKQKKMQELWQQGLHILFKIETLVPEKKQDIYKELFNLGKFVAAFINTGINISKWYNLNIQLLNCDEPAKAEQLLNKIEAVALDEIANAREVIPCVEEDSRLGWEPSMEYMTDRWHLEWKIKQVESVINGDIATFRKMLKLNINKD